MIRSRISYVKYLVPTGTGSFSQLNTIGGSPAYQLVDDTTNPGSTGDQDASYLSNTNPGFQKSTFTVIQPIIPSTANISGINIYACCRLAMQGAPGAQQMSLENLLIVGGTTYSGTTVFTTNGSYQNYSNNWATNPKSGVAWTADDVNGIGGNALQEIGVQLLIQNNGGPDDVRCTNLILEVTYDLPGAFKQRDISLK